jgi:hypothetical protein
MVLQEDRKAEQEEREEQGVFTPQTCGQKVEKLLHQLGGAEVAEVCQGVFTNGSVKHPQRHMSASLG